jgi:hypothetical protein
MGPAGATGAALPRFPSDVSPLASSPIARELGTELATQLLLCLNGTLNEPAFRKAALAFLDRRAATTTALTPSGKPIVNVDEIFNWLAGEIFQPPRPSGPLEMFEYVLGLLRDWQGAHPDVLVHKASGYYWAALRDIELDNIDRGLLYMHQSAIEDAASHERPMPPTPSVWFITMDPTNPNQAYHERVVEYASIVEGHLTAYRDAGLGMQSMTDVRDRLQRANKLSSAVALLHVVAQLKVLTEPSTRHVRDSEFAALVYSRLALEVCLVFEELLAPLVRGSRSTLGAMLPSYRATSIQLTASDRDQAAEAFRQDLNGSINSLLDKGELASLRQLTAPERDLLLLYGVRNQSAHRLGGSPLFARRFEDLVRHLLFAVFYLIEERYA